MKRRAGTVACDRQLGQLRGQLRQPNLGMVDRQHHRQSPARCSSPEFPSISPVVSDGLARLARHERQRDHFAAQTATALPAAPPLPQPLALGLRAGRARPGPTASSLT